ncbi:hypothetical protein AX15_003407 [Amanita polypyramis BW_CC]|nr:hypothetical protein AX15_003407 [Amanita polypyramis BW_CC]
MNSPNDIPSLINSLRSPIYELPELLFLLVPPLKAIGLLPSTRDICNVNLLPSAISIRKHIPLIQRVLIEHVVPYWEGPLNGTGNLQMLEQYFCPAGVINDTSTVMEVILAAYSTISSLPLADFSVYLLQRLSSRYPIGKIFKLIFKKDFDVKHEILWEDYVRNLLSIPSRVANELGTKKKVPPAFEQAIYFNNLCLQYEQLIGYASSRYDNDRPISSVVYLLTKLVNQGAFPPAPPLARSQASFFQVTLPSIRQRLEGPKHNTYSTFWSNVVKGIPTHLALQSFLRSFFATLQDVIGNRLLSLDRSRAEINAQILQDVLGTAIPENSSLWECLLGLLVDNEWHEELTWSIVRWISGTLHGGEVSKEALQILLDAILNVWTSRDHIAYSFVSRHRYMTTLLLAITSYLQLCSKEVQDLALSTSLITAIGYYISHTDNSIQLCGMLVAEVLSSLAGKGITFDVWEGTDEARLWARHVRELIEAQNTGAAIASDQRMGGVGLEKGIAQSESHTQDTRFSSGPIVLINEGFDSDDSITGYASSSRSPSPTVSELGKIEKEPSLSIGINKIPRPVYLSQLGELLRSQSDGEENGQPPASDKVEMALGIAETLIYRKKGLGTELEENTVNLAHALLGLQNNYDLPQFDVKRQAALNALITCSPVLAAPCIIEEFFKSQYSVAQRFAALEALVFGAQKLASVQPPESLPTKSDTIPTIVDDVIQNALQTKESSNETSRLSSTNHSQIGIFSETMYPSADLSVKRHNVVSFASLSTPYFISPLISRFWLFIRDEQSREQRTALHEGGCCHRSAGTGLILNPLALPQLLRTLVILVHLSRLSPEWLAIVAVDSLEIALTVGAMPTSPTEMNGMLYIWEHKEAAVLTAALELALVVLDDCLELDHGHFLSLHHTALLRSAGEWALAVFSRLNQGFKVSGGGGMYETSLMRTTIGVLLKVDNITSHWRRSMTGQAFS